MTVLLLLLLLLLSSVELGDGYANTDDDERISEILENLDERSLDLLVSTIDLSDLNGEPVEDSLMKREEKALAYS